MIERSKKASQPVATPCTNQGQHQGIVSGRSKVKLPELQSRRFHGDPKELSNKDSTLSNIEIFTYLQSVLHGDALKFVKGLSLTEANYKEILDILEQFL